MDISMDIRQAWTSGSGHTCWHGVVMAAHARQTTVEEIEYIRPISQPPKTSSGQFW